MTRFSTESRTDKSVGKEVNTRVQKGKGKMCDPREDFTNSLMNNSSKNKILDFSFHSLKEDDEVQSDCPNILKQIRKSNKKFDADLQTYIENKKSEPVVQDITYKSPKKKRKMTESQDEKPSKKKIKKNEEHDNESSPLIDVTTVDSEVFVSGLSDVPGHEEEDFATQTQTTHKSEDCSGNLSTNNCDAADDSFDDITEAADLIPHIQRKYKSESKKQNKFQNSKDEKLINLCAKELLKRIDKRDEERVNVTFDWQHQNPHSSDMNNYGALSSSQDCLGNHLFGYESDALKSKKKNAKEKLRTVDGYFNADVFNTHNYSQSVHEGLLNPPDYLQDKHDECDQNVTSKKKKRQKRNMLEVLVEDHGTSEETDTVKRKKEYKKKLKALKEPVTESMHYREAYLECAHNVELGPFNYSENKPVEIEDNDFSTKEKKIKKSKLIDKRAKEDTRANLEPLIKIASQTEELVGWKEADIPKIKKKKKKNKLKIHGGPQRGNTLELPSENVSGLFDCENQEILENGGISQKKRQMDKKEKRFKLNEEFDKPDVHYVDANLETVPFGCPKNEFINVVETNLKSNRERKKKKMKDPEELSMVDSCQTVINLEPLPEVVSADQDLIETEEKTTTVKSKKDKKNKKSVLVRDFVKPDLHGKDSNVGTVPFCCPKNELINDKETNFNNKKYRKQKKKMKEPEESPKGDSCQTGINLELPSEVVSAGQERIENDGTSTLTRKKEKKNKESKLVGNCFEDYAELDLHGKDSNLEAVPFSCPINELVNDGETSFESKKEKKKKKKKKKLKIPVEMVKGNLSQSGFNLEHPPGNVCGLLDYADQDPLENAGTIKQKRKKDKKKMKSKLDEEFDEPLKKKLEFPFENLSNLYECDSQNLLENKGTSKMKRRKDKKKKSSKIDKEFDKPDGHYSVANLETVPSACSLNELVNVGETNLKSKKDKKKKKLESPKETSKGDLNLNSMNFEIPSKNVYDLLSFDDQELHDNEGTSKMKRKQDKEKKRSRLEFDKPDLHCSEANLETVPFAHPLNECVNDEDKNFKNVKDKKRKKGLKEGNWCQTTINLEPPQDDVACLRDHSDQECFDSGEVGTVKRKEDKKIKKSNKISTKIVSERTDYVRRKNEKKREKLRSLDYPNTQLADTESRGSDFVRLKEKMKKKKENLDEERVPSGINLGFMPDGLLGLFDKPNENFIESKDPDFVLKKIKKKKSKWIIEGVEDVCHSSANKEAIDTNKWKQEEEERNLKLVEDIVTEDGYHTDKSVLERHLITFDHTNMGHVEREEVEAVKKRWDGSKMTKESLRVLGSSVPHSSCGSNTQIYSSPRSELVADNQSTLVKRQKEDESSKMFDNSVNKDSQDNRLSPTFSPSHSGPSHSQGNKRASNLSCIKRHHSIENANVEKKRKALDLEDEPVSENNSQNHGSLDFTSSSPLKNEPETLTTRPKIEPKEELQIQEESIDINDTADELPMAETTTSRSASPQSSSQIDFRSINKPPITANLDDAFQVDLRPTDSVGFVEISKENVPDTKDVMKEKAEKAIQESYSEEMSLCSKSTVIPSMKEIESSPWHRLTCDSNGPFTLPYEDESAVLQSGTKEETYDPKLKQLEDTIITSLSQDSEEDEVLISGRGQLKGLTQVLPPSKCNAQESVFCKNSSPGTSGNIVNLTSNKELVRSLAEKLALKLTSPCTLNDSDGESSEMSDSDEMQLTGRGNLRGLTQKLPPKSVDKALDHSNSCSFLKLSNCTSKLNTNQAYAEDTEKQDHSQIVNEREDVRSESDSASSKDDIDYPSTREQVNVGTKINENSQTINNAAALSTEGGRSSSFFDERDKDDFVRKKGPKGQMQQTEKKHKCTRCHSFFPTATEMMRHDCRIVVRQKIQPPKKQGMIGRHQCDVCERSYHQKSHLNNHVKIVHLGVRPYKCELCEMAFGTKQTMVVHMRTHTNTKPFECNFCKASWITTSHLHRHYRKYHFLVANFHCEFCDLSYFVEKDLEAHVSSKHKKKLFRTITRLDGSDED